MADKESLCRMTQMSIFSFLLFFPLAFSKNEKERFTVNNYLKTLPAWIICGAIRAGLSFNSILGGQPNIIPARSGFGPLCSFWIAQKAFAHSETRPDRKNLNAESQKGKEQSSQSFTSAPLKKYCKKPHLQLGPKGIIFYFPYTVNLLPLSFSPFGLACSL